MLINHESCFVEFPSERIHGKCSWTTGPLNYRPHVRIILLDEATYLPHSRPCANFGFFFSVLIVLTSHELHRVLHHRHIGCLCNNLIRLTTKKSSNSICDRWIALAKGQYCEKRLHVMTSLCTFAIISTFPGEYNKNWMYDDIRLSPCIILSVRTFYYVLSFETPWHPSDVTVMMQFNTSRSLLPVEGNHLLPSSIK